MIQSRVIAYPENVSVYNKKKKEQKKLNNDRGQGSIVTILDFLQKKLLPRSTVGVNGIHIRNCATQFFFFFHHCSLGEDLERSFHQVL